MSSPENPSFEQVYSLELDEKDSEILERFGEAICLYKISLSQPNKELIIWSFIGVRARFGEICDAGLLSEGSNLAKAIWSI